MCNITVGVEEDKMVLGLYDIYLVACEKCCSVVNTDANIFSHQVEFDVLKIKCMFKLR